MIHFITFKKDLFSKYILTTLNMEEFKTLLWEILSNNNSMFLMICSEESWLTLL
jgi:hypothetical protein